MIKYGILDGGFSKGVPIGKGSDAIDEAKEYVKQEYIKYLKQLGEQNFIIVQDSGKGAGETFIDEYVTYKPYTLIYWDYFIIAYEDTNSSS